MWLFLSARLRRWLLVAFVLPLVGRVLEGAGRRTAPSRPKVGDALTRAGGTLRYAKGRRRRR